MLRNYLRVQAPDHEIVEVLNFIRDREAGVGSVDFGRIDPIPPWVYQGELDPLAEAKYGAENCWKQWSLRHWGCARNAAFPERSVQEFDGGDTVVFFTEDNDAREIVRKLSLIFKDASLDIMWADEDVGKHTGMASYQDGEQISLFLPEPFSRRAYEMSFDVFGTTPESHGLVFDPLQNNYVYAGREVERWSPPESTSVGG